MTKELSLYHLSEKHRDLLSQLIDQETGEVNEQVEAQINELLPALEEKCLSVAKYIKSLESQSRELALMKEELAKREQAYNKELERCKEYLKENMEKNGITKVSCTYFTLKLKKNRHSTDILDEFQIPSQFINIREIPMKIESKPDKDKIREAVLKTGVQIPGAYVSQKTKLEIMFDKL